MKMTKKSHLFIRLQNVLFYILFLTIIGLLAWLGRSYHKSVDVTAAQRNTLSLPMQQILSRLDKPLELVAYVPDDATIHVALKKLVGKYRKYKKDIKLEFVNPDLDPARAEADGIQYSGQVLIKLGDKSDKVNSVAEQNMVNVLQRLSRDKPRLVVFLEGHKELSPLDERSNGLSRLANVLQSKGFSFQPHNLIRTQDIPQDASFVVIAAPKQDYLPAEVKIIEDYIDKGGNLLWLHEPGSLHGLDDIEQQLGLEIHEGTLLDANQALQKMLGIKHPAAIAVIDYGGLDITKDLAAHTLFPFATAILQDPLTKDAKYHWQYQPFLSTLPTSWLESGEIQGNVKFDDDADIPGPLTIGMALTRALQNRDVEQRIIVIGDSDFMQNTYLGQGSNLQLASNLFNWLGQDDELISINTVKAKDTRLELPPWALYGSAFFFLVGLPLGLLIFGFVRWILRRKK